MRVNGINNKLSMFLSSSFFDNNRRGYPLMVAYIRKKNCCQVQILDKKSKEKDQGNYIRETSHSSIAG